MIGQLDKSEDGVAGEQVLHRISALTLGFGFAATILAMALHQADWAKGLAGGAVLGWLNFRWLSRGIKAMMNAALPQAAAKAPANDTGHRGNGANSKASAIAASFALLFRYALVALGGYVIFICLHVPLVSIGLGLCALVAAIMTASVWEIVRTEF